VGNAISIISHSKARSRFGSGSVPWAFLEVEANALHTFVQEIENTRGIIGNVNNSTVHERATIIDAHYDGLAIAQVGHPHKGAEWQGRMCGGEVIHVKRLTAGRGFSVVLLSVPRRGAHLEQLAGDRTAGLS
jgi:hypothetical protein